MSKYAIQLPTGSGKACRGCAKTISLQVVEQLQGGCLIKKLFRFTNGNEASMRKAYGKANAYKEQLEREDRLAARISGGEHDVVKAAIAEAIGITE